MAFVAVAVGVAVGVAGFSGTGPARAAAPTCPVLTAGGGLPQGSPTSGQNWSGCNLQGLSLYRIDISNDNMSGANLQDAFLNTVSGGGDNFSGADLSGAILSYTTLSDSNLTGANLQGLAGSFMNFTGSDMTGADISNANMGTYTLTDVKASGLITSGGAPTLPAGLTIDNGYLVGPGVSFKQDDFSAPGATLPSLHSIDLSNADFYGANLTGMDLSNDNLSGADFLRANLTSANLNGVTLTSANFSQANLSLATLDGASLSGVTWFDTTCPDGTNSAAHSQNSQNCAANIDDRAPAAQPAVTGTIVNGWYRQATVTWNWTESNGTINTAKCPASTASTAQGKPAVITATCANTAGAAGKASVTVNMENKGPAVAVTGVQAGKVYPAGHVPAPGCHTTDTLSGVAKAATLSVTSAGWQHGTGTFTATCAGAANRAGITQGAVHATYTVAYGLSGFAAPKNKATVARSARKIPVSFKLTGISASLAAKFAAAGRVRVTLTGPGITAVTVAAAWQPRSGTFTASLPIPAKAKTGKAYQLRVRENTGPGWVTAPVTGKATNPETIEFRA